MTILPHAFATVRGEMGKRKRKRERSRRKGGRCDRDISGCVCRTKPYPFVTAQDRKQQPEGRGFESLRARDTRELVSRCSRPA